MRMSDQMQYLRALQFELDKPVFPETYNSWRIIYSIVVASFLHNFWLTNHSMNPALVVTLKSMPSRKFVQKMSCSSYRKKQFLFQYSSRSNVIPEVF